MNKSPGTLTTTGSYKSQGKSTKVKNTEHPIPFLIYCPKWHAGQTKTSLINPPQPQSISFCFVDSLPLHAHLSSLIHRLFIYPISTHFEYRHLHTNILREHLVGHAWMHIGV